jgi:hypothetical protein
MLLEAWQNTEQLNLQEQWLGLVEAQCKKY